MKRINLLLITIVLLFSSITRIYGKDISESTAKTVAENFLYSMQTAKSSLSLVYNRENAFYVFGNKNSFVIISGDDRVQPVLAYSTESAFIQPKENDTNYASNVYGLLAEYEKSIRQIKEDNTKSSAKVSQHWQNLLQGSELPKSNTAVVAPLMTTTWGQGWPYNADCPTTSGGSNGHVWTGCVPTAMAQIIHYNNKNESSYQGVGSYSYQYGGYPETTAEFGNTIYDMNSMPDAVSDISDPGASEIAKLNYHAAVGCRAMWGSGSTGVSFNINSTPILCDIPMLALVQNYLPLAASAKWIYKNSQYDTVPDAVWHTLLQNELVNNRVIYYRGSGSGGHAWVCDGVDENEMYHFNFGWDGDYNGYYLINLVNPGGLSYSDDPLIIIGLSPNDGSTLTANTTWTGTMNVDNIVVPDAVTLTIDAGTTDSS